MEMTGKGRDGKERGRASQSDRQTKLLNYVAAVFADQVTNLTRDSSATSAMFRLDKHG